MVVLVIFWCSSTDPQLAQETELGPQKIKQLWSQLASSELEYTTALLKLSSYPDAVLEICQKELQPLLLDEVGFQNLIFKLGSSDTKTWTAAYEELSYRDPRLFGKVPKLMSVAQEQSAYRRLVGLLSYQTLETFQNRPNEHSRIEFKSLGEGSFEKVLFSIPGLSWAVDCRIANMTDQHRKPSWDRAMRALVLLELAGNTNSAEWVQRMATGHPDAAPTKRALEIADRIAMGNPSTTVTKEELQQWWHDLANPGIQSTYATLSFIRFPNEAIGLLKQELLPLRLSQSRLEELYVQLASDDASVWQAAYREFEYFDPRLVKTVPEIMDGLSVVNEQIEHDQQARLKKRLAAVLSGWALDEVSDPSTTYGGFVVSDAQFYHEQNRNSWTFVGAGIGSWQATELSLIGERLRKIKPKWDRAIRALAILDHIGSEQASDLLAKMATGNEKAAPTRYALELLNEADEK